MLRNGSYSAWYRTPLREGTGIVVLNDGKITGGDGSLVYAAAHAGPAIGVRHRQCRFDADRHIRADDGILHRDRQASTKPRL